MTLRDGFLTLQSILVMAHMWKRLHGYRGGLALSHRWGGGTEKFLLELLKEQDDCLVVRAGKKQIDIELLRAGVRVENWVLRESAVVILLLRWLILCVKIDRIHVNHLAGFRRLRPVIALLLSLSKRSCGDIIYYLHDHYALCPGIFLLNHDGVFCGLPEMAACETCAKAQKFRFSVAKDISGWRQIWLSLFSTFTQIVFFSESSRSLFLRAYGGGLCGIMQVAPHQATKASKLPVVAATEVGQKIRMGIIGSLARHKGHEFVRRLISHAAEQSYHIDFILVGELLGKEIPGLRVFGGYKPESLASLSALLGIDVFLLPSVCPETFSFAADEVMAMGYPLMVLDVGAPPERVMRYTFGKVVSYQAVGAPDVFFSDFYSWYIGEVAKRSRNIRSVINAESIGEISEQVFFRN